MLPVSGPAKLRLDILMTERGLVPTRSRARDLIKRGLVSVDGQVEMRGGTELPSNVRIEVNEVWSGYVSRGALKLAAALDQFSLDCSERVALDIGASTGGFTQALLRRGAQHVYAVDVGSGQLHELLVDDNRVTNLENTDARQLSRNLIADPVDAIVADVSFISLTKALPAALSLAAPGCWLAALVKPQFEVGRERVARGGIVRDNAAREAALAAIADFLSVQPGWEIIGTIPSPITGQSGNAEYLIGAHYAP
jgi:23S rRNA (cytidine1920-2'-O)/16S rRNA (cytidine1409-2'-O)-methyltransferase